MPTSGQTFFRSMVEHKQRMDEMKAREAIAFVEVAEACLPQEKFAELMGLAVVKARSSND